MCDEKNYTTGIDNRQEALDFLTACFHENVAHCRHIEMERLLFLTIFAATIGYITTSSAIDQIAVSLNLRLKWTIVIAYLILDIAAVLLVSRWNQVYKWYMGNADACYSAIYVVIEGNYREIKFDTIPKSNKIVYWYSSPSKDNPGISRTNLYCWIFLSGIFIFQAVIAFWYYIR